MVCSWLYLKKASVSLIPWIIFFLSLFLPLLYVCMYLCTHIFYSSGPFVRRSTYICRTIFVYLSFCVNVDSLLMSHGHRQVDDDRWRGCRQQQQQRVSVTRRRLRTSTLACTSYVLLLLVTSDWAVVVNECGTLLLDPNPASSPSCSCCCCCWFCQLATYILLLLGRKLRETWNNC